MLLPELLLEGMMWYQSGNSWLSKQGKKRYGGDSYVCQIGKDIIRKPSSTSGRTSTENYDGENSSPSSAPTPGIMRMIWRNPVIMPHTKVARTISVKDVIAVLEKEPQMSKSMLVYCLLDKVCADAPKT